ncbi:MAG: protoporphyrinogen oxidase [Actinomycetota bacterium]|nr:protoporphyrinogen oxidase [Actinomycetota bacterium]
MSPSIAVVGGGIAGLAAAHALAGTHEVLLFEADERLGGKLRTATFCGRPVDLGPDVFISRDPAATELVQAVGLGDALSTPNEAGALIYARGRPRRLPSGLMLGVPGDLPSLARSGILSPPGLVRAALGLVWPARPVPGAEDLEHDPSVAEALGQLGSEAVGALIDPLLGGINAGDVRRLSLWSTAPALAGMLAGQRTLAGAMRSRRRQAAHATPGAPGSMFLGLASGMSQLVDALATRCAAAGVQLAHTARIDALHHEAGAWRLAGPGTDVRVDGVVLAVPAFATARLLTDVDPELAGWCAQIEYASVITVTLAYPIDAVPAATTRALACGRGDDSPLPGTGMLLPRSTGALCTALTFMSTKWPRSAPPGHVVIRASTGRFGDERSARMSDEELLGAVRDELRRYLRIEQEPTDTIVQRWPQAFPQYGPGTRRRLQRIGERTAELASLQLCGAAFGGIGIPACIRSGNAAAASLEAALGRQAASS